MSNSNLLGEKSCKYIPVQMFIRITRNLKEHAERAILVARRENGQEYIFTYKDYGNDEDLTVCDFIPSNQ